MRNAIAEQIVDTAQDNPNSFTAFIPLILIFVIFYFLIIRPQVKKQKEQKDLANSLKKGDRVIFAGGILGTVSNSKDETYFEVEIANGANIKALKSSIVSLDSTQHPKKKK
ncbi:MAG: preprotein translocase subunit YajC [Rickettsiales bacterium]